MDNNVRITNPGEYEEYVAEDETLDGGRREEVRVVRVPVQAVGEHQGRLAA